VRGRRLLAFLTLTRPVFLLGGVMMYGLGLAWVAEDAPRIDMLAAVVGQVMVTATQLVAQYANEYYDDDADLNNANRTYFSGGSGVFASRALPRVVALRAAQVCAAVSLVAILFLAFRAPVAAMIGAVSLPAAWFYSAPPVAFARRAWGEIEASILVTILVPYAAYATQSALLSPSLIMMCLPLFFLHMAMLIAFSLPDRETDALVGKDTLAVVLGARTTIALHNVLLLVAILILGAWAQLEAWRWWYGLTVVLPVAQFVLALQLLRPNPPWKLFTLVAVASFAVAAAGMLAGMLPAP
jgi:1,4-dihydroxy-2-naphthoate polyprenyltransferase